MKSRFGICGLTVALLLGITFSFPDLGALSSQTFRQVAIASVRAPYPTGQVEQQPETSGQAGQGEEAQRKQEIAIRFKKISLLIEDQQTQAALSSLESILQSFPKEPDAHFRACQALISLGDYVAAESQLNQALALATDSQARNEYQLALVELNHKREKQARQMLDRVSHLIAEVNYSEAAQALGQMDKIITYDQQGYMLRAGLLGVYRRYEEALKAYNRVLADPSITPTLKSEAELLRDYCANQVTTAELRTEGGRICHFCHAPLTAKAAYCPVCLTFQPQTTTIKGKHITTSFEWKDRHLQDVSYRYYDGHDGGNAFRSILGGLAAGSGGGAVPVTIQDADDITRRFGFKYEGAIPQGVSFESKAEVGGSTTFIAQSVGGVATTTKNSREQATNEATQLNDTLVYASHPKIDATFALLAFKQNIYRGFAANWRFDPFGWEEPHIFALYYDQDRRLNKAVECYTYAGETNAAGHLVVKSRKPFTGANHTDPLQDRDFYTFTYNNEGLLSEITNTYNGKEVYRRQILYAPQGIIEEREYREGKLTGTTKYNWKAGKLVSAKKERKAGTSLDIFFQ